MMHGALSEEFDNERNSHSVLLFDAEKEISKKTKKVLAISMEIVYTI